MGKISAKLRLNVSTIAKCYLYTLNDLKRFNKKQQVGYRKFGYNLTSSIIQKELKEVFAYMAMNEPRFKDLKKGIIRSIDWATFGLGITICDS